MASIYNTELTDTFQRALPTLFHLVFKITTGGAHEVAIFYN